jgi:phage terminase large subunit-like protein
VSDAAGEAGNRAGLPVASFVERAVRYAQRSLAGEIPAGKWHKAACRRFLDDLERQGDEAWPYVLSEAAAERICNFAQLMPHVEGEWARPVYVDGVARTQKIHLEDWQVFLLVNLFGWVNKATGCGASAAGTRRSRARTGSRRSPR